MLARSYKNGPIIRFERNDGQVAEFDLRTKKGVVIGKKGPCESQHTFKRFFGKVSLEHLVNSFREEHMAYGKLVRKISSKESRATNIGTLLTRLANYSHLENWMLLGIECERFSRTEDYSKEALGYIREFGFTVSYQVERYMAKTSSTAEFALTWIRLAKIEFANEPELKRTVARQVVGGSFDNIIQCVNTHSYDIRRFMRYVFDYLPNREGRGSYDVSAIFDYANMRSAMAQGRSWDKYPRFFESTHDIVAMQYRAFKREYDNAKFLAVAERHDGLAWVGNYVKEADGAEAEATDSDTRRRWIVEVPKTPEELQLEGGALNHCVASYVNRVIGNELMIVFLRNVAGESLYTLEVRLEEHGIELTEDDKKAGIRGFVLQARGYHNCTPDEPGLEALEAFCKARNLKYMQK